MIPFNQFKGLSGVLDKELLAAVGRVASADGATLPGEVEGFENAFAAYLGVPHAAALATVSDAVAFAFRTGGLDPGDEVLTTPFVPPATLRGLQKIGLKVVFVDVDPLAGTMCPTAAAAAVTPRTRALLPVHTDGHPADMPALLDLAARNRLLVVEDCTEAAGAKLDGRAVGTFGELSVFGFDEGGVVATRNGRLAAWLWRLRRGERPDHPGEYERDIDLLGTPTATDAAKLSLRLGRIETNVVVRRRLSDLYCQLLGGVVTPRELEGARHVYTRYAVRSTDRDRLRAALKAAGVETDVPPRTPPSNLPVAARFAAETLYLPFHVGLTETEVRSIVRTVHGYFETSVAAARAA